MKQILMILFCWGSVLVSVGQTYYYDRSRKGVENQEFAEYRRVLAPSKDTLHYKNKYRDYYISGEKKGEGEYIKIDKYDNEKSLFDGEQISYYKNGNMSSRIHFKRGKQIGDFEYYYENGLLQSKGTLCEKGMDGIYTEFQGDGTTCVQVEYNKGEFTHDYYTVSNNLGCVSRYRIKDNSPVFSPVDVNMRKTQYVDDLEWQSYYSDGLMVAFANDKVYDYGNYISFPIVISNGTMTEIDFLPERLSAVIVDGEGNEYPLEILSRKEYMAKVDRSQSWSRFFANWGANATAQAAGTSTSTTSVNSSNVSGSSSASFGSYDASGNAYGSSVGAAVGSGGRAVGASNSSAHANMHANSSAVSASSSHSVSNTTASTTNYDGAAAYQAMVIERARVAQYDEALAQDREAHFEGYLKRATISPGEKIQGLLYAKKVKIKKKKNSQNLIKAKFLFNGQQYNFEWNSPL